MTLQHPSANNGADELTKAMSLTGWRKLESISGVPAGDADTTQSNTDARSGAVYKGQLRPSANNSTDELTEAPSLTSWGKLERRLVVFTDGRLDHGGKGSAAGQYATVIAERVQGSARLDDFGKRDTTKLKVLAKQGGVGQGPTEWMSREWMSSHEGPCGSRANRPPDRSPAMQREQQ